MVGLDAALNEDLPVRRPLPRLLVDDLQIAGVQPGKIRGQSAEEAVYIRCGVRFDGDPDPAVGLGAALALQAQGVLVDAGKARSAVSNALERAAVVPGPGVIGADKAAPAAACCIDQPGAAMAADIEEGMHRACAIAGQEQRQSGKVAGQEPVRPGQFAAVRNNRRQCAEQHLPFTREPLRAGIARHRRGRDGVVEIEGARLAQASELLEQLDFR